MKTLIASLFVCISGTSLLLCILFRAWLLPFPTQRRSAWAPQKWQVVSPKSGKMRAIKGDDWYPGNAGDIQLYIHTYLPPHTQISKQAFKISTPKDFNLRMLSKMVPETTLARDFYIHSWVLHRGQVSVAKHLCAIDTSPHVFPYCPFASLPGGAYCLVICSFCSCHPPR